jgi:ASC-1-like (ASCH) protein
MAVHRLKCWEEYFSDVQAGKKNFEIRQNDRDFKVGDCLVLEEVTHGDTGNLYPTGKSVDVEVTYITDLSPFVLPRSLKGFGSIIGMSIRLIGGV